MKINYIMTNENNFKNTDAVGPLPTGIFLFSGPCSERFGHPWSKLTMIPSPDTVDLNKGFSSSMCSGKWEFFFHIWVQSTDPTNSTNMNVRAVLACLTSLANFLQIDICTNMFIWTTNLLQLLINNYQFNEESNKS